MSMQEPITDKLYDEIERLLETMSGAECDSEEYAKMADQLTKLYKMREIDKDFLLKDFEAAYKQRETEANCNLKDAETKQKKIEIENTHLGLSMETWALIGANLAGIVVVLGYERVNIITSKAFNLVSKLR